MVSYNTFYHDQNQGGLFSFRRFASHGSSETKVYSAMTAMTAALLP